MAARDQKLTELFKCCACQATWRAPPGPQVQRGGESACPCCPSLYVRWVSYEEDESGD